MEGLSAGVDRIPRPVRPIVLLAPGAALLTTFYWLDYPATSSGVFTPHRWSTAGVIAGWWLFLLAVALIGRTPFISLLALLSTLALATVNGDNSTLATESWTPAVGVLGAALALLLAASTELVDAMAWQRWIAWSMALAAIGAVVILVEIIDSSVPVVASPAGELMATLVVAPVFVGVRAIWRWRYGPPERPWLAGCPWWGWVALISFGWAVTLGSQALRGFEAPDVVAYPGAIAIAVVAIAGIVSLAPRALGWSEHWLPKSRPASTFQSPPPPQAAPPKQASPPTWLEWDGNQFVPANPDAAAVPPPPPPQRREFFKDWPGYLVLGCVAVVFGGSLLMFVFILAEISWQRAQQGDFVASVVSLAILAPIALLITLAVRRARKT